MLSSPASTRRRAAAALVAAMAAVAMLFGPAGRAEASTYLDGCSVAPGKPEVLPYLDSSGHKLVKYPVAATCVGTRSIHITQLAMEEDNGKPGDSGGNDQLGGWTWIWNFSGIGGTKSFEPVLAMGNYDTDVYNELFHQVHFYVCANLLCNTPGSLYERSPLLSAHI